MHARVKQLDRVSIQVMQGGWCKYAPESDKRHGNGVHGEADSGQQRALVMAVGKDNVAHCV